MLLALLVSGCAVSLEEPAFPRAEERASSRLVSDNALSLNGLGTNGLGTNGLGTNGLSTNGLNNSQFLSWFDQDPALADTVMKYVVGCAAPAGAVHTWTHPTTGILYTWHGSLGLTPSWAGGTPATEVEQQLITACLAAHTNKYSVSVPFSLQGVDATGTPLPVEPGEFSTFAQREACFFGNLFTGAGIFAGNELALSKGYSSARACGLQIDNSPTGGPCPPIEYVEQCNDLCIPDPLNNYFVSCTRDGKSYRAITTRIRPQDIHFCGDGICQVSESCGTKDTPDKCIDCGPCP